MPQPDNPYKPAGGVEGANFYGRADLLARAQREIVHSNVVLLQGQRRIGKTWFLHQLGSFLAAEGACGLGSGTALRNRPFSAA